GEWLMDKFGGELVDVRRARERAARALENGPAARVEALGGAAMTKTTPPPRAAVHAPSPGAVGPSLSHAGADSQTTADQAAPDGGPGLGAPSPVLPMPQPPPVVVYQPEPRVNARTGSLWALAVVLVFSLVYAVLRLR